MQKQTPPTDEALTRRAIAYLGRNGPSRLKPMTVYLKVSYSRLNTVLRAAASAGRLDMIADGKREGETVYLFAVPTGKRAAGGRAAKADARPRVSFNAAENLAAFLSTAAAHVEQLRARNPKTRGMYA